MALRITILADTANPVTPAQVAQFLADFEALYEGAQVFTNERYANARTTWGERRVLLDERDRLYVERVTYGTVTLTVIGGALLTTLGAAKLVIDLIEKVQDRKIDRAIKEENLKKLRRENRQAQEQEHAKIAEQLLFMPTGRISPSNAEIARRLQSMQRTGILPRKVEIKNVGRQESASDYLVAKKKARDIPRPPSAWGEGNLLPIPQLPNQYDAQVIEEVKRFLAAHEGRGDVPPAVLALLHQYVERWTVERGTVERGRS